MKFSYYNMSAGKQEKKGDFWYGNDGTKKCLYCDKQNWYTQIFPRAIKQNLDGTWVVRDIFHTRGCRTKYLLKMDPQGKKLLTLNFRMDREVYGCYQPAIPVPDKELMKEYSMDDTHSITREEWDRMVAARETATCMRPEIHPFVPDKTTVITQLFPNPNVMKTTMAKVVPVPCSSSASASASASIPQNVAAIEEEEDPEDPEINEEDEEEEEDVDMEMEES